VNGNLKSLPVFFILYQICKDKTALDPFLIANLFQNAIGDGATVGYWPAMEWTSKTVIFAEFRCKLFIYGAPFYYLSGESV
jgi:hypothetical protein